LSAKGAEGAELLRKERQGAKNAKGFLKAVHEPLDAFAHADGTEALQQA
jgi:hypothetical protein